MITYNTKDWLTFIFRFHKSDTVRQLWKLMIFIALYSWAVAFFVLDIRHLSNDSHLKNLTLLHNLLGFVLSFLLVFRNNSAYDRWWEGRKLWGSLVNNSRNLALKINAILPDSQHQADRHFFAIAIPMYAKRLSLHLKTEQTRLALDEQPHPELAGIDLNKHVPNQVAGLLYKRVQHLYKNKQITDAQLLFINNELQSFTDICGACERIKNTPIPFSYSSFLKKFVFIYIMTLPFGFVFSLGFYVIPVVTFIFYVLTSLELIAEEIEDPFGEDVNDLPTEKMAENIKKQVHEILQ
ncbi:MAG: hypothetical protein RLY16_1753 [Bacteroidota bacterium]|jgi:putative membrane protein